MRVSFLILIALCAATLAAPMSYYEVLGVTRDTPVATIKRNYRVRTLKYHPDKVEEEHKERAEEIFQKLAIAQATLIDKEKKWRYEKMLQAGIFDYTDEAWDKLRTNLEDEWAFKGKHKASWVDEEVLEYENYWESVCLYCGLVGLLASIIPVYWSIAGKKKSPAQKKKERAAALAAEREKLSKKVTPRMPRTQSTRQKGEPRKQD